VQVKKLPQREHGAHQTKDDMGPLPLISLEGSVGEMQPNTPLELVVERSALPLIPRFFCLASFKIYLHLD